MRHNSRYYVNNSFIFSPFRISFVRAGERSVRHKKQVGVLHYNDHKEERRRRESQRAKQISCW